MMTKWAEPNLVYVSQQHSGGNRSTEVTHDDNPAVNANGTVMPSAKPIIMSRMTSPLLEWLSAWLCSGAMSSSDFDSSNGSVEI